MTGIEVEFLVSFDLFKFLILGTCLYDWFQVLTVLPVRNRIFLCG